MKLKILLVGMILALSVMNTAELSVQIKPAKEANLAQGVYDEFVADAENQQMRIVLTTDFPVTKVKILSLKVKSVDAQGKAVFAEKELYTQESLTSKRPLVLNLTFLGDIPNYGVSYIEENGSVKRYAIGQSGEDGSLLLTEYRPASGS